MQAQPIQAYDLQVKKGTFAAIDGGTTVGQVPLDEDYLKLTFNAQGEAVNEKGWLKGLPIGFNFMFNDMEMNQFIVSPCGLLRLGKDSVYINEPKGSGYLILGSSDEINAIGSVSNITYQGAENTEISYLVTGEAPNRTLVVQWKNVNMKPRSWEDDVQLVDMQIRLKETSNVIEIVYNRWASELSTLNKFVKVGLRGYGKDRLLLSESWTQPVLSLDETASINYSPTSYPANGLTLRFLPPSACETPGKQPAGLSLTASSTDIQGSFEPAASADHYIVLLSKEEKLSELPTDGKLYAAGDSIGNAQVIAMSSLTTFNTKVSGSLDCSSVYYLHVFSTNTLCVYGPKYLTDAPLSGKVATLPGIPSAFEVISKGLNTAVCNVKANEKNERIVIARTTVVAYNDWGNMMDYGAFGTPANNAKAGDAIEGGGEVIYVGEAAENIEINDLQENTIYFFRAWSMDEEGKISSTFINSAIHSGSKLPFTIDLTKEPEYTPLIGWETVGDFQTYLNKATEERFIWCLPGEPNEEGLIVAYTVTPWLMTGTGLHHVMMDLNLNVKGWMGSSPYNDWLDGETLRIQLTEDGVNYQDIELIDKNNCPQLANGTAYEKLNIPFSGLDNRLVKLRFLWTKKSNAYLQINNLLVEDIEELDAPTQISVDADINTANISWEGDAEAFILAYKPTTEDKWTTVKATEKKAAISNLKENTEYMLRMKSVKKDTLISVWSETISFSTKADNVCVTPSELNVTAISSNAATLNWTADNGNLSWTIRYRKGTESSWTMVEDVKQTSYTLEGLDADVAYIWSVMATCEANSSTWASQNKFTTEVATAISQASLGEMDVFVKGGMLNIVNPEKGRICRVYIYNEAGQLLRSCLTNTNENIFIPMDENKGMLIVKICGNDQEKTVKVNP